MVGLSFTITVERVKAEISAVNISANSKLTLSQDSGTAFDGNDWEKDRSRDGNLRAANPISVTSGNALTFIPTFEIFEETAPEKVKAEFSVPGKAASSQIKGYADISSGFSIPAPVSSGNIDYFDNSLRITWSVHRSADQPPAGNSFLGGLFRSRPWENDGRRNHGCDLEQILDGDRSREPYPKRRKSADVLGRG